jgi:hypothetical protein
LQTISDSQIELENERQANLKLQAQVIYFIKLFEALYFNNTEAQGFNVPGGGAENERVRLRTGAEQCAAQAGAMRIKARTH